MNNKIKTKKEKKKNKGFKNNIIQQNDQHECFICLEIKYNNEDVIKLNESLYYAKLCECNSYVHNFCLNKWYSVCYICPICRTIISDDVDKNVTIINHTRINVHNRFLRFILIFTKLNKKIVCFFIFSIMYLLYNNIIINRRTFDF
jgi:hypothetical protein